MPDRIVLFPGMGADQRLHGKLRLRREVVNLDWITFTPSWDLRAYASEYIRLGHIRPGDAVGGTSMGGMVALGVASLIPVSEVVLISSCTHPRYISKFLKHLAPLAQYVPFGMAAKAPDAQWLSKDALLLLDMARRAHPGFMRWAIRSILQWPGYQGDAHIRSIHGSRDYIIPLGNRQVDKIIPGGGHFAVLSHAHQISSFLDGET